MCSDVTTTVSAAPYAASTASTEWATLAPMPQSRTASRTAAATDRWARRLSSPWGSLQQRHGAAAEATSRDAKWQRTWSTRSLPTPRARPRTASASATGTRPRRHRRRPPRPCRRRSRAARDDRDDFRDGRDRVGAPPGADGADGRPADRRGPRTAARRGGNSRVPDRVPGRQYKTVLTVWALCTDAWTVSTSRRTS